MVAGKGSGLAQQRLDHMPVVNHRQPARRPGDLRAPFRSVVNLQMLFKDPGAQPPADKPRRHRIGHALDPDRAVRADTALHLVIFAEPGRGQFAHQPQFLRHLGGAQAVGFDQDAFHKLVVITGAGEVPRPAQQQMLLQAPFQMAVVRFDIPVLIGALHMNRSPRQPVMRQQRQIIRIKLPFAFVTDLVGGRAAVVGLHHLGRFAQPEQGRLQPLPQGEK